jgi:hypothetical protein
MFFADLAPPSHRTGRVPYRCGRGVNHAKAKTDAATLSDNAAITADDLDK